MSRRGRHGYHGNQHAPRPAQPGAPLTDDPGEAVTAAFSAGEGEMALDPAPAQREPTSAPVRATLPAPAIEAPQPAPVSADQHAVRPASTCTQAQLRRFIKSRPWVPMHELRRRFGIYGEDDDVTPVRVADHTLFIGLPSTEGRMMGELLASGDVGYELSLDPVTPVVVGVYPMRPVPRG